MVVSKHWKNKHWVVWRLWNWTFKKQKKNPFPEYVYMMTSAKIQAFGWFKVTSYPEEKQTNVLRKTKHWTTLLFIFGQFNRLKWTVGQIDSVLRVVTNFPIFVFAHIPRKCCLSKSVGLSNNLGVSKQCFEGCKVGWRLVFIPAVNSYSYLQ